MNFFNSTTCSRTLLYIVRANMSENSSLQLSKNEMVSQMAALTIAGHETTANTLTWLLWELAKHPRFQEQLREEIRQKRKEINVRVGEGVDFKLEDLESMPFLQAVLKVRFLTDTTLVVDRICFVFPPTGDPSVSPNHLSSY